MPLSSFKDFVVCSSANDPSNNCVNRSLISSLHFFVTECIYHVISLDFTAEEKTALEKHNAFRKVHQAPPMTLDRQMCDKAKAYAQKLAEMGSFQHSSKDERDGNGENLSFGCSSNKAQTVEEAATNW